MRCNRPIDDCTRRMGRKTFPFDKPNESIESTALCPLIANEMQFSDRHHVYLGVHIDCHLNYNEHIAKTVSTCTYMLSRVNRIKHLLDRKTLVFLMNTYI